jgi:predicted AAA+ superfamily ATPase
MAFPEKPYASLETPATRELALSDPIAFLAAYPDGAILDEAQRAPELFSYLQGMVDEDPRPGRFLLTGSQNLGLLGNVTQSLAGRTAVLELLPLGLEEIRRFGQAPDDLYRTLWTGGYPRIFAAQLPADEWLASYITTYLERDVRQILKVGDLLAFQTFLQLAAARTGQLLNLDSLAADCGITHGTAKAWLSVLEASYIAYRLPPFHANLGKRLVKSPKLYFYDTGLACSLLGIHRPEQLASHPLRGPIFETWVVGEIVKQHLHRGRRPRASFYGERGRLEIDLLLEDGVDVTAIEIKSSQTPSAAFFDGFDRLAERFASQEPAMQRLVRRVVVYGGAEVQKRSAGLLLPWSQLEELAR